MNTWIAMRNPRVAQLAVKNIFRSAKIQTKSNYFSCLRSCFAFMYESGLDPMDKFNYKPEVITFWVISQADRLGSCNSWSTWISAMTWWLRCIGGSLEFLHSEFYKEQRRAIKNLYKKKRRKRLPMKIIFLEQWLKKKKISCRTWSKIEIDLLCEALFYIIDLFSISRPGELLYSDNTEFPEWEILTTGLKWEDIEKRYKSNEYNKKFIILEIEHYKNKAYYDAPKLIPMAAPTCNDFTCNCKNLDFIKMLGIYKRRRKELVMELKQFDKSKLNKKELKLLNKRIRNLETKANNFVFVSFDGTVWETRHIASKLKTMVKVIKLEDPQLYTNYSWRIGSMSICNQQDLDMLKVLYYVAWSLESMPHVSNRYCQYSEYDFAEIPFEMYHGVLNKRGKRINKRLKRELKEYYWDKSNVAKLIFA